MFFTTMGNPTDNAFVAEHSTGAYVSNAYKAEITTLYACEDVSLRKVVDRKGTRYEVLIEDVVYSKEKTEKAALSLYADFIGADSVNKAKKTAVPPPKTKAAA